MIADAWRRWLDYNLFGPESTRRPRRSRREWTLCLECLEDRCTPTVVSLSSVADNTLYEDPAGNLSNGAGQHFYVGETAQPAARRGLIKFDLSSIPAGATINSVTLVLNMSKTDDPSAQTTAIHKASKAWGEAGSIAGFGGSNEGGGTQAATGDATWLFTLFNTQSWTTPGGDFSSTVSASTQVGSIGSYQWTGSGMIADVQQWVGNSTTNFGWVMTGNEAALRSAKQFDTKENANAANRPTLTIDYTAVAAVPDLTIALSHTGTFSQGDAADTYKITVSNAGSGATSGTVTVTDTLPTGLSPTGADSGVISGWTVSTNGQTITATRSDALANGVSYPDLTLTVAVSPTAPTSVTNTASVSGGGETNTTNNSASDPTTIVQVASLKVQGVQINDGSFQRSMISSVTVTFSSAVGSIDAGAFQVTRQGGGDPTVVVSLNGAKTAATLTFTGSLIIGGSLQDGNFSLVMDSTKIHATNGGQLDGDGDGVAGGARPADTFFRLFGDSDGDRDVDNLDLFRFRQSFGLTSSDPNYKSYFDFDNDGDVDNLDLFRLRQRFGTNLPRRVQSLAIAVLIEFDRRGLVLALE